MYTIETIPNRSPDPVLRVTELEAELRKAEAELKIERLRRKELEAKLAKLLNKRFGASSEPRPPVGAEIADRRSPAG